MWWHQIIAIKGIGALLQLARIPRMTQKPHKLPTNLKKIVNMNSDISENIKDRELGFQI